MKPPDILMADSQSMDIMLSQNPTAQHTVTLPLTINTLSYKNQDQQPCSFSPADILQSQSSTSNIVHSSKRNIGQIDHDMQGSDCKRRKMSNFIDSKFVTANDETEKLNAMPFSTIDNDILPIPIESLLLELNDQHFNMNDPINNAFLRDRISSTDIEEWANEMT